MIRIALLLVLILNMACGHQRAGRVVVGSKNFTEQSILGEILAQQIERSTALRVDRRYYLGGTLLCHNALVAGQIDMYVEYTGTALTAILKRTPIAGAAEVYRLVRDAYRSQYGVELAAPLGFNNTFAILVRGETARNLGVRSLSEAAEYTPSWRAAFGPEFMEREDGFSGLARLYGLRFREAPKIMDLGLTYRALAENQVDLIAGDSTNGLIETLDLVSLDDDRGYFPPYEAVPLVRAATLAEHPGLMAVLNRLGGTISNSQMRRLNYAVDGEHRDLAKVVAAFLTKVP